jgi:endoglucanase
MTSKQLLFFVFAVFIANFFTLGAQSVVSKHGRLQVQGNTIVDKTNTAVSLAGNSLFWSTAGDTSDFYNAETVAHLTNDWNTSIIRIAMGVKEDWDGGTGYVDSPEAQTRKIKKVIDAAIANGIYVIIDWHTHEAEAHLEEAITFFEDMAETYGTFDNVIYEIYNEPIRQSWQEVKTYANTVIAAIRAKDPDNLIIVGSPTWSQDVDVASQDPIDDANTAYTIHFYAASHKQALRNKAQTALNNGIALFATEWGTVDFSGNGTMDRAETDRWMQFLQDNKISHANWAVSDKNETSSIVINGRGLNGLRNDNLTASGAYVKSIIQNWVPDETNDDDDDDDDDDDNNDDLNCDSVACILNAMRNATPGDEIVIAPGTYIALEKDNTNGRPSRFFSDRDGNEANPITIRAEDPANPPILKAPEGSYDGYVMRILGDYWHVKDLILEDGSKGLVFDNANYGRIENITVRDIGEEGIHLRDGSSHNLVTGCSVSNTGVTKPGFGEGLYVGSDKSQHNVTYNPDCDFNTLENCIVGPNITAEGVDVKEGTTNTIIRGCTFSARGITGDNSADAFIDLKGVYTFVYNNTFNLDGSTVINAAIDFQDRKTDYKTGFRNAVFNNTFNLGSRGENIPSMRAKGGSPSEIHFWNNERVPNTIDPISNFSLSAMVLSCPDWNIEPCAILSATSNADLVTDITIFPNPVDSGDLTLSNLPLQDLNVSLVDLQGKVIRDYAVGVTKRTTLDISYLKAGVYIVSIRGKTFQKALLVSKQ